MTTGGRWLAVAVVALCLPAADRTTQARQGSAPASVEAAVLATNAEMTRAAEAGDPDRLFGFMLDTDKGSVIQNGVFLTTRADALQRVKTNLRSTRQVEYHWKRQYVTVLSADAALLTAEGESVVTTTDGQVFTAPFAQTVVFVMREGHWKVLHAHQSSPQR